MSRATQHSTASGTPDHLDMGGVQGVSSGPLPYLPHDQRPPSYQGVALPLDPLLAAAGAFWNERRELVRRWRIHNGPSKTVGGRTVQEFLVRERHVAPPGMTLEDARAKGLDFYSPQWGWIRAGLKREHEDPQNLGNGAAMGEIETEDVTAPDGGAVLAEPAALR